MGGFGVKVQHFPLTLLVVLTTLTLPCKRDSYRKRSFYILLGRPEQPFRTGLCFTRDVSLFSPRFLRSPSTDRPETLPHGRNLAVFYNPTPKILGRYPKKIGAKNMQNFGQFWTTSEFDREYLRNG